MNFNPEVHHRRSIRLRDYDYSGGGAYFVTVCTFERVCLFGEVVEGAMRLDEAGLLAAACWEAIPGHFPNVDLDQFVIMPNHVHGILLLSDNITPVGAAPGLLPESASRAQHAAPLHPPRNVLPGSLGAIIRSFKGAATKRINTLRDNAGAPVWQRNYFERVIRDDRELDGVRQYIADNPVNWLTDENHP